MADLMAKPFLRWVGGKSSLLPQLTAHVPTEPFRYAELFLGGGALFFELESKGLIKSALLVDANERLIRAYRGVRKDWQRVASLVRSMPVQKDFYRSVRAWPVDQGSDAEVATWLLYVNFAGYGGLYRVNSKGQFNVPFDTARAGQRWDGAEELRAGSTALDRCDLLAAPFDHVHPDAEVLYLDPPYLQKASGSFANGYTADGFGLAEHHALALNGGIWRRSGVRVLASNSAAAAHLWRAQGFTVEVVEGERAIGARHRRRSTRLAETSEAEILAW